MIACVIVTYNRIATLKKTIEAVTNQTRKPDVIIIVDNNSSDGTQAWIADLADSQKDIMPLLLDRNYGGAGGFYYGIKGAYEAGSEWIWVMDDDCIAAPDALERLLEAVVIITDCHSKELGFLSSKVNWVDGNRHKMNIPGAARDWWHHHEGCPLSIKITHASFVSTIISARAVREVGYPVKEFFIWHDDVEYTNRITKAGFAAYSIENSVVTHVTPSNHGPDYCDISRENLWKWQYGARNWVAFRKKNFGILEGMWLLISIFLMMKRNRVSPKMQLSVLFSGLKGLFYRYENYIVYPLI
jgi:rhamnopyranosyl-N-acetylglucosaminyl-diphospho-decaprenol beta-1,3/1,4-galactofuranosyltransferase